MVRRQILPSRLDPKSEPYRRNQAAVLDSMEERRVGDAWWMGETGAVAVLSSGQALRPGQIPIRTFDSAIHEGPRASMPAADKVCVSTAIDPPIDVSLCPRGEGQWCTMRRAMSRWRASTRSRLRTIPADGPTSASTLREIAAFWAGSACALLVVRPA